MASLDRMKGDAIEGGTLALMGILVLLAVVIYSGFKGFKLPSLPDFDALVKKVIDAIKSALPSLPDIDTFIAKIKKAIKKEIEGPKAAWDNFDFGSRYTGQSGPDQVYAGTNVGLGSEPPAAPADGSSLADYSGSPEWQDVGAGLAMGSIAGAVASQFGIDPYAGLPKVDLPRI